MRAAILAFGAEQQLRMLQEECIELAHAISKHLRDKENHERRGHVSDEIADVLITIEQAMLMFNSKQHVQNEIERKLKRLKATVKEFKMAKKMRGNSNA